MVCFSECAATGAIDEAADDQAAIARTIPNWLLVRTGGPLDYLLKTVGVDGPTASSARIGAVTTKTGAVHDSV
jgi:hypothetical protein